MEKIKAIMKIESFSHKDGMLLLNINDYGFRAVIKSLVDWCQQKYGSYIKLEMSPPYRPKTLKELGKYWSMCTEYGKYCGMDKNTVSEGVKFRAMEEGLWRGTEIPFSKTGQKVPDSISTSDTKELAILIDVLYRIAAEDGFVFMEDR